MIMRYALVVHTFSFTFVLRLQNIEIMMASQSEASRPRWWIDPQMLTYSFLKTRMRIMN